jgi:hypothetical protein
MAAGRAPWLAAGLVAVLMVVAARARFVVEKSSVRVLAPEHIRGHHDAAIGNFGVPDYGGTLTGVVIYPDTKPTGCDDFDAKFKAKSRRPVILLLDRGGIINARLPASLLLLLTKFRFHPFLFPELNTSYACLALWN